MTCLSPALHSAPTPQVPGDAPFPKPPSRAHRRSAPCVVWPHCSTTLELSPTDTGWGRSLMAPGARRINDPRKTKVSSFRSIAFDHHPSFTPQVRPCACNPRPPAVPRAMRIRSMAGFEAEAEGGSGKAVECWGDEVTLLDCGSSPKGTALPLPQQQLQVVHSGRQSWQGVDQDLSSQVESPRWAQDLCLLHQQQQGAERCSPSEDFVGLCREQLSACAAGLTTECRLSVYLRTPRSFLEDQLELVHVLSCGTSASSAVGEETWSFWDHGQDQGLGFADDLQGSYLGKFWSEDEEDRALVVSLYKEQQEPANVDSAAQSRLRNGDHAAGEGAPLLVGLLLVRRGSSGHGIRPPPPVLLLGHKDTADPSWLASGDSGGSGRTTGAALQPGKHSPVQSSAAQSVGVGNSRPPPSREDSLGSAAATNEEFGLFKQPDVSHMLAPPAPVLSLPAQPLSATEATVRAGGSSSGMALPGAGPSSLENEPGQAASSGGACSSQDGRVTRLRMVRPVRGVPPASSAALDAVGVFPAAGSWAKDDRRPLLKGAAQSREASAAPLLHSAPGLSELPGLGLGAPAPSLPTSGRASVSPGLVQARAGQGGADPLASGDGGSALGASSTVAGSTHEGTRAEDCTERGRGGEARGEAATWLRGEEERHVRQVAKSLALACALEQRTMLTQLSTQQHTRRLEGLLLQAKDPLVVIRTLAALLAPQVSRTELGPDMVQGVVDAGAQLSEVLEDAMRAVVCPPMLLTGSQPPSLSRGS